MVAIERPSNANRATYRKKCREKLSGHISMTFFRFRGRGGANRSIRVAKLGIYVDPTEVRLITSADDAYTWQNLPRIQYLFQKQLSKHSVRAYRELC